MASVNRYLAIKAAYNHLREFPEPHSTHHTSVCHQGYSWEQPNGFPSEFVLVNEQKDTITRDDFNEVVLLLNSPIVLKHGSMDNLFNIKVLDEHELITDSCISKALEEQLFNNKPVSSILELCNEIKNAANKEQKKFFIQTFNSEVSAYRWNA